MTLGSDLTDRNFQCTSKERQLEGIASAKARDRYKGRKASIDPGNIRQMKVDGMGPSAIAKALKIGRASAYRAFRKRVAPDFSLPVQAPIR